MAIDSGIRHVCVDLYFESTSSTVGTGLRPEAAQGRPSFVSAVIGGTGRTPAGATIRAGLEALAEAKASSRTSTGASGAVFPRPQSLLETSIFGPLVAAGSVRAASARHAARRTGPTMVTEAKREAVTTLS